VQLKIQSKKNLSNIFLHKQMDDTKRFFYPSLVEELLSSKTTSINQEKEVDFQQRKMTMERDALKEEKLR